MPAPQWSLTIKNETGTTMRSATGLSVQPDVKKDANGKPVAVHWEDGDGVHDMSLPEGWEVIVKQTA